MYIIWEWHWNSMFIDILGLGSPSTSLVDEMRTCMQNLTIAIPNIRKLGGVECKSYVTHAGKLSYILILNVATLNRAPCGNVYLILSQLQPWTLSCLDIWITHKLFNINIYHMLWISFEGSRCDDPKGDVTLKTIVQTSVLEPPCKHALIFIFHSIVIQCTSRILYNYVIICQTCGWMCCLGGYRLYRGCKYTLDELYGNEGDKDGW